MKFEEAMKIIDNKSKGYMVSFERVEGSVLASDHFPDKHGGETLIETEAEAWRWASKFALATYGKCVNIYVTDDTFSPVKGYCEKKIKNR